MSQDLIEAVARALYAEEAKPAISKGFAVSNFGSCGVPREYWLSSARAAIAAIEASGFVVVPKEPTLEMDDAAFDALRTRLSESRTVFERARDVYLAMLSARPKVTT